MEARAQKTSDSNNSLARTESKTACAGTAIRSTSKYSSIIRRIGISHKHCSTLFMLVEADVLFEIGTLRKKSVSTIAAVRRSPDRLVHWSQKPETSLRKLAH